MLTKQSRRIFSEPRENAPPISRGLLPQVGEKDWLLVLGSFPGQASLRASQYYSHPQNQFWRLLGGALDIPLAEAHYERRLELLREHGVGLWDVITEARRAGSLDSAIREAQGSDLRSLLLQMPALHTIAFNGGTAHRMGLRQLGDAARNYRILALPSSSPAYTRPFADKLQAWRQIPPTP